MSGKGTAKDALALFTSSDLIFARISSKRDFGAPMSRALSRGTGITATDAGWEVVWLSCPNRPICDDVVRGPVIVEELPEGVTVTRW